MLSSAWFPAQAEQCNTRFEKEKAGFKAVLAFSGACDKGMFALAITPPDGRLQTFFQAHQAPVTGIWLERLTGAAQPDLVMLSEKEGKLFELIVYSWVNGKFSKRWMADPEPSMLELYDNQDKIYVRWGTLVRQIKLNTPEGEGIGWRRLSYDFSENRWVVQADE